MNTQSYNGSCHCRCLRFRVEPDLAAGSGRCDCALCRKHHHCRAVIPSRAFTLLSGADTLGGYRFGSMAGHFYFSMASSKSWAAPMLSSV